MSGFWHGLGVVCVIAAYTAVISLIAAWFTVLPTVGGLWLLGVLR